ncbi:DUF4232 domain-containing protein [Streptacidiphilus sp. N1-12]|uniref:DUF4232 domain-containing protein n=2 Tax=Streptacidiphilus alkalitolerans TaxID=3342712 RepID=A0ABV6V323_9ACTN
MMPTPARLVLTAAVLGLALTACSSNGGTSSAPTPGAAGTVATTSTPGPSGSAGTTGGSGSTGGTASGGTGTAAATGGADGSSVAPRVPAASACTGDHLAVSAGQSSGAAGHIGARVVFKNTSGAACTLYGFPGLAGLDAKDKQVVQAKRVTSGYLGTAKESMVTLAPGGTASALVGGVDVPSGNATSCPSYPALLVTPPGTRASTKVALQMPGCPTLVVYPVVAGVPAM